MRPRRRPAGSPRRCPPRPLPGTAQSTMVPGRVTTVDRRHDPAFAGSPGSITARSANATADTVTARTALVLPGRWSSVPVKSNSMCSPSMRTVQRRSSPAAAGRRRSPSSPSGHLRSTRRRAARRSPARQRRSPYASDLVERRTGELAQPGHPHDVGPALRVQVAGALVRGAGVGEQQLRATSRCQPDRRETETLGVDLGRVGGQRTGRRTADICVVRTVGDPARPAGRRASRVRPP